MADVSYSVGDQQLSSRISNGIGGVQRESLGYPESSPRTPLSTYTEVEDDGYEKSSKK